MVHGHFNLNEEVAQKSQITQKGYANVNLNSFEHEFHELWKI